MAQNDNAYKLALKLKKFKAELPKAAKAVGIVARDFFRLNFNKGGFDDSGVKKWKPRKFEFPGKGRATLTGRGNLRDNIQYTYMGSKAIVFNNQPYAQIHNEGGTIGVTPRMRAYFWAKYYEARGNVKINKKGEARKTKTNEKLNAEAEIWKNLALKKGSTITIDKRQFMGDSKNLNKKVDAAVRKWMKDVERK
ncbi:MAG: phage virion morphogenesis protein [Bacteroidetes bacterium]|nr:phage virion morphogenesis protein [Bacteroidota bacterium]